MTAALVTETCTGVEYLTQSGWRFVDPAEVPLAAITRPAQHDWGPWSHKATVRKTRTRRCIRCDAVAETLPPGEA